MEIYIIDNATLDRLGTVDEYKSFIWTAPYNDIGTFELECRIDLFPLLQTERFVQCTEDEKHIGIIEDVLKVTSEDGSESLKVKGRFAEVVLERRVAVGEYAYGSTPPSEIAADMITKNAIDNRPIENLEIGTLAEADAIDYAGSNEQLLSEVQAICQASYIGFNVKADTDNKKLIFETYSGIDRTEDAPLVFSRDRDTLISLEYEKNITNECNYIFIKGDGDVTTHIIAGDEEKTGLALKERFLDLSSISRTVDDTEIELETYKAMLQTSAMATMRQLVVNEMIDGEMYKLSNKKFGTDFFLGDIAIFVDEKMGLSVPLRISSVQQTWGAEGHTVVVSLGDDVPAIYETIKLVMKGAK